MSRARFNAEIKLQGAKDLRRFNGVLPLFGRLAEVKMSLELQSNGDLQELLQSMPLVAKITLLDLTLKSKEDLPILVQAMPIFAKLANLNLTFWHLEDLNLVLAAVPHPSLRRLNLIRQYMLFGSDWWKYHNLHQLIKALQTCGWKKPRADGQLRILDLPDCTLSTDSLRLLRPPARTCAIKVDWPGLPQQQYDDEAPRAFVDGIEPVAAGLYGHRGRLFHMPMACSLM